MTRINDAVKTLMDWADSRGGLEAIARDYDGDLTGAVEALDDAGHLLPDLLPGDRDGCWWPKHGRKYGHVKTGTVWNPERQFPGPGVIIARGGPGESSKHTSLYLTPAEAEELASLLLAAAHHERNQE